MNGSLQDKATALSAELNGEIVAGALKDSSLIISVEVEAVKIHYLVPRRNKVAQELLLGVLTSVDFRNGPELGVRTED